MSSSEDLERLEFDETRYIEQQRLIEVLVNTGIITKEEELILIYT